LQQHGLSALTGSATEPVERRAFVAAHAGDIWYGNVMHGPKVAHRGRLHKSYLVSFMDDASRLITHSAFCLGETALEVEEVLKQALLKRGLPKQLVIDYVARHIIHLKLARQAPAGQGDRQCFHEGAHGFPRVELPVRNQPGMVADEGDQVALVPFAIL
jgi:hypothetical protein